MIRLHRSTPFLHPQQSLYSLQRPLPHLLFLLFLYSLTSCSNGVASQDKSRQENRTYPLLNEIPITSFSCVGHSAGYYADPDTGCQVYHMCDTLEKQYSYLCPNHTLFNQKFMVCDHWYMVNCSSSKDFYELNHHIGEVPDRSRGSRAEVNTIHTNALGNHARDNPVKDTKLSSVAVTFKSPLLTSAKPRLPSVTLTPNRPTTQRPTTKDPASFLIPAVTQRITTEDPWTNLTPTVTQFTITKNSETPVTPSIKHLGTTKDPEGPITKPSLTNNPQTASPQLPPVRESILKPLTGPSQFFPSVGSSRYDTPKVSNNSNVKPSYTLKATFNSSISTNTRKKLPVVPDLNIPSIQTPRPDLPFKMMPASVARKPGSRFTFTSSRDEKLDFSPIDIQGLVSNPFEVPTQSRTRTVLTGKPSVANRDPHLQVANSGDENTFAVFVAPETSTTSPFQVSFGPHFPTNFHDNQIPNTFLRQPQHNPFSINLAPFNPVSQHQSGSPIKRIKQEFPTPLTSLVSNVHLSEETIPGALHIQFSSSQGNRDFFIPTAGLSLPAQEPPQVDQNSLQGDPDNHEHHHHHESDEVRMTMVFPAPLETRMVELQLNPQCPRCHPAFLRPGECRPCVFIK